MRFSLKQFPKSAIVLYDPAVRDQIKPLLSHYKSVPIAGGETSKRLSTVEKICTQLVQLGCDRSSAIIAVGGGVVGDIAGFVASVYMRGIPLHHVPTTLLAMVDSSLGGKNGVDLAVGKNLVGTIYQPEQVIIDPGFLVALPEQQFNCGMAEVIKHGVLEASLFTWLEQHVQQIKARHLPTLRTLIARNVAIKTAIVKTDERETGQRMLLNLGHTFAHAFEQLSHYRLPHGEAVAIGLAYASAYANMLERNRLLALLSEFNLPTTLPKTLHPTPSTLVQAMQADKKNRAGTMTLVLPVKLGEVHIETGIAPKVVEKFLQNYASN